MDQIEMRKESKQEFNNGDLFLVPISDGGSVIAQVLAYEFHAMNSAVCAFTMRKYDKAATSRAAVTLDEVISIQFVTVDLLESGDWPVVGNAPVLKFQSVFDLARQQEKHFVGTHIAGSRNIMDFLEACFGLAPWDDWYDPHYLDKLLLSPDRKPKLVVYKDEKATS